MSWSRRSVHEFSGGRYEVSFDFPRAITFVRVEADGYRAVESRGFGLDEGEQVANFKLARASGPLGCIRGPDRKPVEGVEVFVATSRGSVPVRNGRVERVEEHVRVVTDAVGCFELPSQTEDFAIVALHDSGYAVVQAEELNASPEVALEPWGRVEGRLLLRGEPAASETVELWLYSPPGGGGPRASFSYETTTDSAGRFHFERVRPGEGRVGRKIVLGNEKLGVRSEGTAQNEYVDVKPAETTRVTLGARGRTVRGRLAVADGVDPAIDWSRARLTLRRDVHIPRPRPTTRAEFKEWFEWYKTWWSTPEAGAHRRSEWSSVALIDHDGSFIVENVPPGPYRITCSLSGPPRAHPLGLGLVAPGKTIATLVHELEVTPSRGDDAGSVIDIGNLTLETLDYFVPGEEAPLFSAKTLDGEAFKLKDLRGKYVFLDFWATWCGPCIREMPNLKALHKALAKDERLVMIGVSIDDEVEAPREFVRKQSLEWMQIILEDPVAREPILESYGVRGVPSTFLIGPDGKLVAKELRGPDARKVIERELGAKVR